MTRAQRVTLWTGAAVVVVIVISTLTVKKSGHSIYFSNDSAKSSTSTTQMNDMPGMNSASTSSVALTPKQIQQLGVTFGTVALRPLSNEVRTVGTVVVNETRLAKVTPKFGGYVEKLYVNFVGQQVRRGEPLAAIFSPDLVAAEQELLVSARLSRTIGASSVPGVSGSSTDLLAAAKERLRLWDVSDAQIDEVLRTGRPMRTVKARITVPNSDGRIKPGMYATVILNSSTQSALTVPRSAVVQTGERALVFVDLGNGRLTAQTVRLGRTSGDMVEVLSGLASGQRVVTSAQFLIDSESNLGEVMKSMIGMRGQGDTMSGMTPAPSSAVDAKGADMRGMPGMSPPSKK